MVHPSPHSIPPPLFPSSRPDKTQPPSLESPILESPASDLRSANFQHSEFARFSSMAASAPSAPSAPSSSFPPSSPFSASAPFASANPPLFPASTTPPSSATPPMFSASAPAESAAPSPVRPHKPTGRHGATDQQRRRELALERQRAARRDLQLHARHVALAATGTVTPAEESDAGESTAAVAVAERREISPLLPEICEFDEASGQWTRIDQDGFRIDGSGRRIDQNGFKSDASGARLEAFAASCHAAEGRMAEGNEFVMPRPDGRRCLVVSANGTTVSRLRNGRILHRFPSHLPNGARAPGVAAGAHVYCILDCIFHEPNGTYYVLDVMAWRGYSLYDCTTEFRFFWLQTHLPQSGACDPPSHFHRFRFAPVPFFECNAKGLEAAYHGWRGEWGQHQ
ncbi:hypothetical protein CLOM_g19230 [Closterium sp. NIES-68]|nr:hypothetical protein CLOM_g19230 [Closterium sp. NIES-68]